MSPPPAAWPGRLRAAWEIRRLSARDCIWIRTWAARDSTGRGEENIRIAGGHTVMENMRHGMTPREACLDALKRVARNFDNDMARLEKVDLNFYALRNDGEYAGASLWNGDIRAGKLRPAHFAVNDGWRRQPSGDQRVSIRTKSVSSYVTQRGSDWIRISVRLTNGSDLSSQHEYVFAHHDLRRGIRSRHF